jgi:hypothetical protein
MVLEKVEVDLGVMLSGSGPRSELCWCAVRS